MHVFDRMEFVSHCYTVVSYQTIFRHSMHTKKSAVYLSSARLACFCKIREFGFPTKMVYKVYNMILYDVTFFFKIGLNKTYSFFENFTSFKW